MAKCPFLHAGRSKAQIILEQILPQPKAVSRENQIRSVSECSWSDSALTYMSKYNKGKSMCMSEERFDLGLVECPLVRRCAFSCVQAQRGCIYLLFYKLVFFIQISNAFAKQGWIHKPA